VILILLAIANFIRIQIRIGFNKSCANAYPDGYSSAHGSSNDTDHYSENETTSEDSHHRFLSSSSGSFILSNLQSSINLASGGSSSGNGEATIDYVPGYETNTCRFNLVKLFLGLGLLLVGYTFVILLFSRLYKRRFATLSYLGSSLLPCLTTPAFSLFFSLLPLRFPSRQIAEEDWFGNSRRLSGFLEVCCR
jgi:hypothetical protein